MFKEKGEPKRGLSRTRVLLGYQPSERLTTRPSRLTGGVRVYLSILEVRSCYAFDVDCISVNSAAFTES